MRPHGNMQGGLLIFSSKDNLSQPCIYSTTHQLQACTLAASIRQDPCILFRELTVLLHADAGMRRASALSPTTTMRSSAWAMLNLSGPSSAWVLRCPRHSELSP